MSSSTLADAITAAETELLVQPADTEALVHAVHQVRHQVYCLERGYEPSVGGLEIDAHDAHARHVALRLRSTGAVIGTARLILPQRHLPHRGLPMASLCDAAALRGMPGHGVGEISRFALSKERQGLSPGAASLSRLALVRGLVQLSHEGGMTHLYAVMERTLLRLLRASSIHFDPVGPLVEYHGLRQPAYCVLADMLARMGQEQPIVWRYLTQDGRYTGRTPADCLDVAGRTARPAWNLQAA